MLLTEDPQMQPVQTPFGVVTFLQVRLKLDMGSSLPWEKSLLVQEELGRGSEGNRRFPSLLAFSLPSASSSDSDGLI